jgi:hypothetical protein
MQPLAKAGSPITEHLTLSATMSHSLRLCLLGSALALTAARCQDDPEDDAPSSHCPDAGPAVKSVTEVVGTVGAERTTHNYAIFAPRPGTTTGVDVGLLCDSLTYKLTPMGKRVRFSGTYHARPGVSTGDTIIYYLTLSQVAAY